MPMYKRNYRRNYSRSKRSVDKQLISIQQSTAVSRLLFTCTYPCTVGGLRWDLSTGNGNNDIIYWAIVVAKEGYNPNTLDLTSGNTLYQPESQVMAFGIISNISGNSLNVGNTNTKRKLMEGDRLYFIADSPAPTQEVNGIIQFFLTT